MVCASTLGTRDLIEVPVETCEIMTIRRVAGQLKNRQNYLVEVTVSPTTGPWANCEGKFVVESSDLIPLVKKYTSKQRRALARAKLFKKIKDYFFGPKVEPIAQLPMSSPSFNGPMT